MMLGKTTELTELRPPKIPNLRSGSATPDSDVFVGSNKSIPKVK